MEISDEIKNMAISSFAKSPLYNRIRDDIDAVFRYQEALRVLTNDPENTDVNTLRIGTVLLFGIIGKIINGKKPKEFTPDDWKDIADSVAQYGVMMDGQKYTEFVFVLFARYIDYSVEINKESVSETSGAEIQGLAYEIRNLTRCLDSGNLTEPDYVDRCLWISFEAMVKLLAAYKTKALCDEYASFINAVADISVQYARYRMYEKEINLLNEYIEGQQILDKELKAKYDRYLEKLQMESDEFNYLIDNAFSPDFDDMLKNSVSLARKAGVAEDKILDSGSKIDSFFTD